MQARVDHNGEVERGEKNVCIWIHKHRDLICLQCRAHLIAFHSPGGDSFHGLLALIDRFSKGDRPPDSQRLGELRDDNLNASAVQTQCDA